MRDLLNRANEFVGIDQRIWMILETGGYGRDATGGLVPVATDAIEHVNAMLEYTIPREDAAHRSGRSRVVRLSGKKEAKFSFESYIVPTDPVGDDPQLPDAHPMLLTAFGAVDTSDPDEIVYSLSRASSKSFRILEEGTHFSRLAVGCVADSVTFTLPGDGKAMMKVEGFAQDVHAAGESTAAALGASVNVITVATGHGPRFEVGGYLDIIDKDDGNTLKATARLITDVTGDVVTFGGAAVSFDAGDIIIGHAPDYTASSSENALLGLKGSFSTVNLGTVDCDLLSAEISIKNNYTPRNNSYGESVICGYVADKRRDIQVKLDVLLTKANYEFYSKNKNFVADDVTIVLAPQDIPAPAFPDATGRTFTFNFPKVEFSIPNIEQPGDAYIKLTLEGVAMASDINNVNDEMTLTIS